MECAAYFMNLWNERVNAPPKNDLISMMAHNEATRNMSPQEFLGNLILLIVGGNDTTRNSLTGGVLALNQNPDQYRQAAGQLRGWCPRWCPKSSAGRRRSPTCGAIALVDTELGGKTIRAGEKVVMWYVSGNRDEEVIDNPNAFIIDRRAPAPPHELRLRHPPLRRQSVGRDAAARSSGKSCSSAGSDLSKWSVSPKRVLSSFREGLRIPAGDGSWSECNRLACCSEARSQQSLLKQRGVS